MQISRSGPEDGIGVRIEAARKKLGLKPADLARYAIIHRATLKNYESGNRYPGLKELRRLSEALQTTLNQLVYGDDSPVSFDEPENKHETWAYRFPRLVQALAGFYKLPVGSQLAFAHLINSEAQQYFKPSEQEKIESFIEAVLPLAEAIDADDKKLFFQRFETIKTKYGLNTEDNESTNR